jgi:hypothetical protein
MRGVKMTVLPMATIGTMQTIMLAEVVVGESFKAAPHEFGDNKPPLKPDSARSLGTAERLTRDATDQHSKKIAVQQRYDSVNGKTSDFGGSEVFVVYSPFRAYPEYRVDFVRDEDEPGWDGGGGIPLIQQNATPLPPGSQTGGAAKKTKLHQCMQNLCCCGVAIIVVVILVLFLVHCSPRGCFLDDEDENEICGKFAQSVGQHCPSISMDGNYHCVVS